MLSMIWYDKIFSNFVFFSPFFVILGQLERPLSDVEEDATVSEGAEYGRWDKLTLNLSNVHYNKSLPLCSVEKIIKVHPFVFWVKLHNFETNL